MGLEGKDMADRPRGLCYRPEPQLLTRSEKELELHHVDLLAKEFSHLWNYQLNMIPVKLSSEMLVNRIKDIVTSGYQNKTFGSSLRLPLWEFVRMLFGVVNSSAIPTRKMSRIVEMGSSLRLPLWEFVRMLFGVVNSGAIPTRKMSRIVEMGGLF
ncbi:hypothetical protein RRG08_008216 [Elysia crispata]|uniref:Uncharacterized protein n=1 Tax=Elysia crispata TaxID=231223 RepID=A0AAE1CWE0_9GAST|nr:hypothetical protein RRG08_008216 [Elysia crispata]